MNPAHLPNHKLAAVLPDPGNAGEISLGIHFNVIVPLTSAGAETRTLIAPSSLGQRITLFQDTYVGAVTLTVNSPVTGLTTLVIGQYDLVVLESVSVAGSIKWAATSTPKAAAATAALTTLTHTAPGTPDYAIQNLTTTTPYGFVTADEGNTVLKLLAALQVNMAEVIACLQAAKLMS